MIDLNTERDQRRAALEPWRCDGTKKDGHPCRRVLMELDPSRPSFIRKTCDNCGKVHVWVEAYQHSR